jgi:hypothetical protein
VTLMQALCLCTAISLSAGTCCTLRTIRLHMLQVRESNQCALLVCACANCRSSFNVNPCEQN